MLFAIPILHCLLFFGYVFFISLAFSSLLLLFFTCSLCCLAHRVPVCQLMSRERVWKERAGSNSAFSDIYSTNEHFSLSILNTASFSVLAFAKAIHQLDYKRACAACCVYECTLKSYECEWNKEWSEEKNEKKTNSKRWRRKKTHLNAFLERTLARLWHEYFQIPWMSNFFLSSSSHFRVLPLSPTHFL